MCPSEFGEILDVPQVVVVVATFLPTNGSITEHQGHCLCHTLVMKLHPPFSEVLFLVSFEFYPTLPNNRIYGKEIGLDLCTPQSLRLQTNLTCRMAIVNNRKANKIIHTLNPYKIRVFLIITSFTCTKMSLYDS